MEDYLVVFVALYPPKSKENNHGSATFMGSDNIIFYIYIISPILFYITYIW